MTSLLEHKWITNDIEDIVELYMRSTCMQSNIHLTDNEYKTLCYFYNVGNCDKENTMKIVELNYFKSKQTVENCKSKLKKYNVLTKDNMFNYTIVPKMTGFDAILNIKIKFEPKNEASD